VLQTKVTCEGKERKGDEGRGRERNGQHNRVRTEEQISSTILYT
jgi:hypothetical protein